VAARILVVDDSPTIQKVVSSILERHGYQSVQAHDGIDALEVLGDTSVDLILVDFVMPRMNGYQFCREIRARQGADALPIVLMSAKGDKIRGQFLRQTGAIDAITKPFDAQGLLAVVEAALKKYQAGRSKGTEPPPLIELESDDSRENAHLSSPSMVDTTETRRDHAALQFGAAVAQLILPGLIENPDLPEKAIDLVKASLQRAITPAALDHLGSLLQALDTVTGSHQVLAGDLSVISIAEVLQLLQLQRQGGTLRVATRGAEVALYLFDGNLDLARSRGMRDEFLLGRYLVDDHAITREALEQVVKGNLTGRPLGERLMELGLATEDQTRHALIRQTSELVYELVRWKTGRFSFDIGGRDDDARRLALQLGIGALVMEGFRRVDEWRLIEGTFDFDEVLYRDDLAVDRLGAGELTSEERVILDAIDGERTVREIVQEAEGSSFELCKILYQFVNSRIVRRKAA